MTSTATPRIMYKITLVCFLSASNPVEASRIKRSRMESDIPIFGAGSTFTVATRSGQIVFPIQTMFRYAQNKRHFTKHEGECCLAYLIVIVRPIRTCNIFTCNLVLFGTGGRFTAVTISTLCHVQNQGGLKLYLHIGAVNAGNSSASWRSW